MAQIAGTVLITAGGLALAVEGSVTSSSGITREAMIGPNGANGYKETIGEAYIEVSAHTVPETDLAALEALTNTDVQVDASTGYSYALGGAFVAGPLEPDHVEGTVTIRFVGGRPDSYKSWKR